MQNYQWAVEITTELLDGHGGVEGTTVKTHLYPTEQEARARREAVVDTVARASINGNHPKYQRLGGAKLVRRPIGAWEEVA